MAILFALLLGVVGGPAMAWAFTSSANKRGYEMRKAKFEAGEGKNPDLAPFGPHKSFTSNAIQLGLIFAVIGLFIGILA